MVTTAPSDRGRGSTRRPGSRMRAGWPGGGPFVERSGRPEFHREIQEAKWCNAKICREVEGSGMNGDLKMKTPKGPETHARRAPGRTEVGEPGQAPVIPRRKPWEDPATGKEKQYRLW